MPTPKHYSFVTGFHRGEYEGFGTVACSTIIGDNGYAIAVVSRWDANAKRYRSDFFWMWPRTNGLRMTWLLGDPVANRDGTPWVRWENTGSDQFDPSRLPYIHGDAVQAMRDLYDNDYAENPKYGGVTIPPLWEDGLVEGTITSYIGKQATPIK